MMAPKDLPNTPIEFVGDERREERFCPVDGRLPGVLTQVSSQEPVVVQCLDVSQNGLGISSRQELELHEILSFTTDRQQEFKLRIQWRVKSGGDYRYGLYRLRSGGSLLESFFGAGLIRGQVAEVSISTPSDS